MSRLFVIVICATALFVCCKTTKTNVESSKPLTVQKNVAKPELSSGYFEMGIIDYEIIDSSAMDDNGAQMMLQTILPAMEGVYVYNKNEGAQVSFGAKDSTIVSIEYYNSVTNEIIHLVHAKEETYMHKTNIAELVSKIPEPSEEELKEFNEMIKRDNNSNESILGFKCDKVEMFEPGGPATPMTISFMTREIPFMSNSFGILGELMGGFPIKIITNMGVLEVTFGATSHGTDNRYAHYLNFDTTEFLEVTEEEFAEKSYELLGR